MGEDTQPKKSKTNILKKETKLGWFFKFILISGAVFVTIVWIGIIYVNITDNKKESLRLQKEIEELKFGSNKQNIVPTTSPQVQQPTTPQQIVVQDTDPVIDCKSSNCGTLKIKRSECSVGICCEIGDDWVWTKSEIECRNAQDANSDRERKIEEEKSRLRYEVDKAKITSECYKNVQEAYDDCCKGCSSIYSDDYMGKLTCETQTCYPTYQRSRELCKD